jgi:TPR repeat protein
MTGSNDNYYDVKEQIRSLPEDQIIQFAEKFLDQTCSTSDAEYLKKAISARGNEVELAESYAMAGSPAAQLVLGINRLHGEHVEKNVSEGLFWIVRSHNAGNTKASLYLAGLYYEGKIVRKDAARAARIVAPAAEKGDQVAQYILGSWYIEGEGVEQSDELAIHWLRESAKQGYSRAIELLNENDIPLDPGGTPY